MKKILVSLSFVLFSIVSIGQTLTSESKKSTATPEICMVTCDEKGTYNEIRWTASQMPEAITVIVYRIDEQKRPIEIGRQQAKDGLFIDNGTKYGDPNSSSFTYLIQYQLKDQTLSSQSSPHQSIFIKGNQKGEFNWNAYQIAPFDSDGKITYNLYRKEKGEEPEMVLSTELLKATDPDFTEQQGKGTIWWIELDNFACDAGKTGTKSNNSNE